MNIDRAEQILEELAAEGVAEVVVCAGSRNSPLVMTLAAAEGFRQWRHFEERSAAFFALGRARALGAPVAVVTTSGTAVAEMLPAAIEAHYSGVPLLLVTADRPAAYRGTGAPQVIEQVGLFGSYVGFSCDLGEADRLSLRDWDRRSPAHVNVAFDEPLIDREIMKQNYRAAGGPLRGNWVGEPTSGALRRLESFFTSTKRPFVVLGQLDPEDVPAVRDFLVQLRAPIYAEAHSGLREDETLRPWLVTSAGGALRRGRFDGLVRMGGVPTARFWRDLDGKGKDLPVCSLSRLPFSGLARPNTLVVGRLATIVSGLRVSPSSESFAEIFAEDAAFAHRLDDLLASEPTAEPSLFSELSQRIPPGANVYLGNSLPIREWDLAATRSNRGFAIGGNRGANGIDGQLSTFLGTCIPDRENWAMVGDLTALYDLSSLWVAPQLGDIPIRIVVVNNGGGKIFARMYEEVAFQNRHELSFASWAAMWGFEYACWKTIPDQWPRAPRVIIELTPDEAATRRFWDAFDRLT